MELAPIPAATTDLFTDPAGPRVPRMVAAPGGIEALTAPAIGLEPGPIRVVTMGRISTETMYFWAAIASVAFDGVAHATEARYACSDGTQLVARFSPPSITNGRVALTFETGRKIVLPQVMSADGGRYANNGIEFGIKGRNATLTRRGDSETCSTR
jgi:membrane-bound inhibitor of C-type lysozyme